MTTGAVCDRCGQERWDEDVPRHCEARSLWWTIRGYLQWRPLWWWRRYACACACIAYVEPWWRRHDYHAEPSCSTCHRGRDAMVTTGRPINSGRPWVGWVLGEVTIAEGIKAVRLMADNGGRGVGWYGPTGQRWSAAELPGGELHVVVMDSNGSPMRFEGDDARWLVEAWEVPVEWILDA